MTWTDKLGNLLKQYTSGGAAAAPAPDVHAHFDQVAQVAPTSAIAEGLTAAFNSDKTPAFGQMLSTLFNNSSGDQKAGVINQLLSSVPPGTLTQILSGAGLAGLVGAGKTQLTPDQAQKLSPEAVQQLATHAQKSNRSVVESVSSFYAQHTTLIKTLGGAALTVALAKVAERQRQA
ncbi:MAG: hypothetical protein WB621_23895 [Candidatus Acidiferrales bacterium]